MLRRLALRRRDPPVGWAADDSVEAAGTVLLQLVDERAVVLAELMLGLVVILVVVLELRLLGVVPFFHLSDCCLVNLRMQERLVVGNVADVVLVVLLLLVRV